MERYTEYKDSGVEWIGEIPAGWGMTRFGRVCTSNLGKMLTSSRSSEESYLARYLKAANIQEDGIHLDPEQGMYFEPGEETSYGLLSGDLLVVEGGSVGLAQVWEGHISPCYIQNALHRVRPLPGYDVRYMKYWLDLARGSGYVDLVCNRATIAHFTGEKLAATPFVVPSIDEQQAIAAWLDEKTAEVDGLIADIERSIELLREYRTSVISEAVTKGLDPNVPMKDSGIEWIGEIPAHWEVLRGKQLLKEVDTRSEAGEEELLTVSHITGVTRRSEKNVNMFMAESLEGYKLCAKNDVAANTMWLWQGAVGVSPCDGVISPSYSVYRQRDGYYLPGYLDMLLRTPKLVETYRSLSTGITKSRLRLYPEKFLAIKFPVPPVEEQRAILARVSSVLGDADGLLEDYSSLIDRLREYRKSLISEAVTGKFKVPA